MSVRRAIQVSQCCAWLAGYVEDQCRATRQQFPGEGPPASWSKIHDELTLNSQSEAVKIQVEFNFEAVNGKTIK